MFSKQTLQKDLENLRLRPTDTVFIHSSMKAIGDVDGGADTVLDALTEYFADGLLAFPTHTWQWMNETHPVFHAATDPSCVGLLTNLALCRPGAVRSLHPDHSVVAFGRDAQRYCDGDRYATTPCPRLGTMGQLIDRQGVILFLGCTPDHNTFLHCVEEILEIPDRIAQTPVPYTSVAPDGSRYTVPFYHHNCSRGNVSDHYDKVAPYFLREGAMWRGAFGAAPVYAARADKMAALMRPVLRRNPDFFLDDAAQL